MRAQALGTLFYCANWVMIFAEEQLLHERRPAVAVPAHVDARGRGAVLRRAAARVASRRGASWCAIRCAAAVVALAGRDRVDGVDGACSSRRPAIRRARISAAIRTRWACSSAWRSVCSRARARRGRRSRRWVRVGTRSVARSRRSVAAAALVAILVTMRVARRLTPRALPRRVPRVRARCARVIVAVVVTLPDGADREDAAHARARRDRAALVFAVPVALAGARVRHAAARARRLRAVRRAARDLGRARGDLVPARRAAVPRRARIAAPVGEPGRGRVLRRARRWSRPCSSRPSPRPCRCRRSIARAA